MALTQKEIISLADNPERGIDSVINEVETSWFDKRVYLNSKTHPVVFCADLIIGTSFGVLNRIDDAISRAFPVHARNITDLSKHMGDEEKVGLFGNPSTCELMLGIDVDAFHNLAKPFEVTVGRTTTVYQKLLFPKDTEITFNGYIFAIENGIEIRYKETSGFQVVYDDSTNNPQWPINDNVLVRDFRQTGGKYYLTVTVPVRQLQCIVTEGLTSNQSSGCTGDIEYSDYLYNVRAFLRSPNSTVNREIKVAFDQDTFDPATPTLALIIDTTNSIFNYEIPDVYIQNGLGIGTVSIYTYVTKGAVTDKDFRKVPLDEVKVNYQDYRFGSGRLGPYSEGLRNSGSIVWGATSAVSGGSNPRPFEAIKASFIAGKRIRTLPITESNLEGTVEAYDYDAVKSIDYVTGRQYAITKELIKQDNKKFNSPMACFVGSFLTSANNLVASGVVLDNGKRITIPHNMLFDVTDYTSQLVNRLTLDRYLGMSGEELVELTSNKTLVYTPFYYVMDTTNNQAVLRTYHLDAPKFNYQKFIAENEALGIEVGVGQLDIEHKEDGYLITLVTKSSQGYKELDNNALGAQLSISVTGSSSLASLAGTFYGITEDEERIWQFKLDSKFDLDVNDMLYFTNFNMFGSPQVTVGSPLDLTMTFLLTMGGDPSLTDTPSDRKIDQNLFPISMTALIETTYSTKLGSRQGSLYSRIRPLVGEGQYRRYETDVPRVYAEDTFKRDPDTGKLLRDENGRPIPDHLAGEIIYNSNGSPRLEYQKGDFVLDDNGNKIQVAPRDLQYHFDFIAFDGVYYFSADEYDKEFAQATKDYFIDIIGQDMSYFNTRLLDRTGMFYQPRSKIGSKQVLVNSNYEMYLKQDLSFQVIYYLTATGYKNQNLKEALLDSTPRILNDILENATTISTAEFIRVLRASAPPEVVGIKLNALAGDTTVDIISNEDSLSGFSIRKLLAISSDRLVSVKEAVDTSFMPHDRSMVNMGPV